MGMQSEYFLFSVHPSRPNPKKEWQVLFATENTVSLGLLEQSHPRRLAPRSLPLLVVHLYLTRYPKR